MINVLIVIPAYNNCKTLRSVVEKAINSGLKILVVNDGSTDGGPDTLDGLAISRIDFPENKGKGVAILAAAEWAGKHNYTHIITIDADGQHNPEDSPLIIEKIKENPWAIIVGNRQFSKEDTPLSSRFGRKWSNLWFRIASGRSIPDSQSGFRGYPVEALRKIRCHGLRYDFEVEILVRGVWAGLDISSIDISVHYSQETKKASHFDPFLDNYRISIAYTRLVNRSFIPWPHKILFDGRKESEKFSLLHPLRSLKILMRENASPKKIAFASMLGIFLGTLPLIACHSVTIFFFATRLRLNRLIALTASNICTPPFVPALAVEAGYFIRHGNFLTEFSYQTLGYEAPQRLLEYLIGALLVGPVLALCIGSIVYGLAMFYQKRNFVKE